MAEHKRIMNGLLTDRENQSLKRSVVKLTPLELRVELEARECRLSGEIVTLQDKLLRAVMREHPRQYNEVPWYRWNVIGAEEGVLEEGFTIEKARKSMKRLNKSVMMTRGTQTDSSDENTVTKGRTVAQVHAPAEIFVSTSASTVYVNTGPRTMMSAMPPLSHASVIKLPGSKYANANAAERAK